MDIAYGSLAWKSAHHPRGTHPRGPSLPRHGLQALQVSHGPHPPGQVQVTLPWGLAGCCRPPRWGGQPRQGNAAYEEGRKAEIRGTLGPRRQPGTTRIGACGESLRPGGRGPRTPRRHAQALLCVRRVSFKGSGHGLLAGALGLRR